MSEPEQHPAEWLLEHSAASICTVTQSPDQNGYYWKLITFSHGQKFSRGNAYFHEESEFERQFWFVKEGGVFSMHHYDMPKTAGDAIAQHRNHAEKLLAGTHKLQVGDNQ